MKMIQKLRKLLPLKLLFYVYMFEYTLRKKSFKKSVKERFEKREQRGLSGIPIFLISFNRLSYIKSMIYRLEKMGKTNIIIIDNASTYPPLLEFYKTLPYEIHYMKKNWGYKVFWENSEFEEYRKDFYMLSDPDIEPIEECPLDFTERFFFLLKKYPFLRKVGFSLKIDDLPKLGVFSMQVPQWEKRFFKMYKKKDRAYYAVIDTTLALYMPDDIATRRFGEALRTAFPYQARHTPWYKNPEEITDEDRYYSEHKTNGWWNVVAGQMTPDKEK